MKSIGIIILILLILVVLILIGVPLFFVWAVGAVAREEDWQIQQQIEDDRLSCGLIEEE